MPVKEVLSVDFTSYMYKVGIVAEYPVTVGINSTV